MNHRGGWALIKRSWASWLQYRSFFFVLAFGWMIPPLIYLFVWSTASEPAPIAGMTPSQFVAYYLVLILVNQLTFAQTNWTVGDIIRMGSLNSWLLKPMSPLYNALASEVAGKVVMMAFVVPVSIVLAIMLRPELHATLTQVVLFFVAVLGAWLLRFFWGLWLACLAFWATRADALLALQDALIFLLGGVVAPVTVLPAALQAIARLLPFYYMVGFPVEVLTGQIKSAEVATGFVMQTAWLIVAVVIYRLVWRSGLKRYSAIGG